MVDILIIGSGGAGLSAALSAKAQGAKVLVVGKTYPTSSQSVMAQGGINASLGNVDNDSIDSHIQDTIKSANGLCDIDMVKLMCESAIPTIEWLESLGVPFSRLEDTTNATKGIDTIAQRRLGGASHKRACYAQDYTGLKIVHTLYDNAIKNSIEFNNNLFLLELITQEQNIKGAVFLDTTNSSIVTIYAKSVILATGGYAGVYDGYTTNAYGVVGDGIASVYRANGTISDMEFVQFHPTALKGSSILISESARGEGGYLINSNNERFVDELKPRDEVARAIFEQIQQGKDVYLDIRHLGEQKLQELLPQEIELCKLHEGVNPVDELIPIKPVAHYSMGGIDVNYQLQINGIKGCFAIGECSNSKVHGANRLGGNSLLEIAAFGKMAGENAYKFAKDNRSKNLSFSTDNLQKYIQDILQKDATCDIYSIKSKLGDIMYNQVGIVRKENTLQKAKQDIQELQNTLLSSGIDDSSIQYNQTLIEYLELKNALEIALLVVSSAINRKESRGAHYRVDYPSQNDKFNQSTKLCRSKV